MSRLLKKHRIKLILIVLILIGGFLRFYNLNWGSPFHFHPDERNIIDLILKSSFSNPESLLKGTFAYGNFPVILTLLLESLFMPFSHLSNITDPFTQTAIIIRTISATFSVLTLYIIYLCGKFWSSKVAFFALFLSVFSVGLIQQAHFGTYDGLVAFCSITVFYFLLRFLKTKKNLFYYASLLILALGTAAKINLLILAIFPLASLVFPLKKVKVRLPQILIHAFIGIVLLISLTALLSPNYLILEFWNSLFYERGLVTGATPVFYTQSFHNTIPIVFQIFKILPFLINPLLTIIFIPLIVYVIYKGIIDKNQPFLLLNSCFLILFLPQAFLFTKWTRYMVPVLPFIYLIISIATWDLLQHYKKIFSLRYLVLGTLTITCIIFSLSYFITVFVKPDTRIEASKFVRDNISQTANALTEPYDLGTMPINSHISSINTFNFYDLDLGNTDSEELKSMLQQSEYIILPSQRLLRSRILNKDTFPQGNNFYQNLLSGELGYKKIYETPCDLICKITYLGDPIFSYEETASVFDRPTVMIFKKNNQE